MYEFEFIPDYWQDEWDLEGEVLFVVEFDWEEGDDSVGVDESVPWSVTMNGVDVTDSLNDLNCRQVEKEIKEFVKAERADAFDDSVSETQEWYDFNPDC